jgi:DNA processing protein
LASLRGIRPIDVHALAWRERTARKVLAAVVHGEAGSAKDREAAERADPDAVLAAVRHAGARAIVPDDPEYPRSLDHLHDPPVVLFARGRPIDPTRLRVAVVGARAASPLGVEVSTDLGRALGRAGVCVVSGAARGVDAASHRGALAAGGSTIAVLGSGIDVWYPAGSRELIGRIAEVGTIVSEYPPGVRAEPHHFPARNRIVVGLSSALVVVEGAERSGSMISVGHALSIGREVYAVPGPVSSPLAQVPLRLIREGATMIRGARDLLSDLKLDPKLADAPPPASLPKGDRRVLETLAGRRLAEDLAAELREPLSDVVATLLRLELQGLVRATGGRYETTVAAVAALAPSPSGGAA